MYRALKICTDINNLQPLLGQFWEAKENACPTLIGLQVQILTKNYTIYTWNSSCLLVAELQLITLLKEQLALESRRSAPRCFITLNSFIFNTLLMILINVCRLLYQARQGTFCITEWRRSNPHKLFTLFF